MKREELTTEFLQQFVGGRLYSSSQQPFLKECAGIAEIGLHGPMINLKTAWVLRTESPYEVLTAVSTIPEYNINLENYPVIEQRMHSSLWFGYWMAGKSRFLYTASNPSLVPDNIITQMVRPDQMSCLFDSELARWPDGHFSNMRRLHIASCDKCKTKTVEAHRIALLTRPVAVFTSA